MEFERLQEHWNAFGEQDPLWAIVTAPGKRGGAWDLEEFLATGRTEVEEVLDRLAERGVAVERGRALDFGCGVGRLTQALAQHFESCDGVDVAISMVERANRLNRQPARCRFTYNRAPDLRLFDDGSFDFLLSLITLQHMAPELMRGYMREFMRVLRPGGVAYFNIPERYEIPEELPPEAWRASINLSGSIPPLVPGQTIPLRVRVRNESSVPWPTSAQISLGDHWRSPDGEMLVVDDARAVVGSIVEPGGECVLQLDVVAPREPGDYQLEFDLVQEWIAWFGFRGSTTLRVPAVVGVPAQAPANGGSFSADIPAASGGRNEFAPIMEMHVMAREEVLSTLEGAGGAVLDAVGRDRCGPAIPSVDYVVARTHEPARREHRQPVARAMDEQADLVGLRLTSERRLFGGSSILLRRVMRRLMFQVLYRQTEFNRTTTQAIRDLDTQRQDVAAGLGSQLAAVESRIRSLELDLRDADVRRAELERRLAAAEKTRDFEGQESA